MMAAFSDPEVMAALQDGSLFASPCFISFPLLDLQFVKYSFFSSFLFSLLMNEDYACQINIGTYFYLVLVSVFLIQYWVRVQQMSDSIRMQCLTGLL